MEFSQNEQLFLMEKFMQKNILRIYIVFEIFQYKHNEGKVCEIYQLIFNQKSIFIFLMNIFIELIRATNEN